METFNILMLGGKRCGKTTVLGSMYNQIEKAVACTDLSISYSDDATKAELTKATDAIKAKMDMFQNKLIRVEVDENATDAKSEYKFTLSVKHYKIPFVIHDVPGEWLENENQEKNQEADRSVRCDHDRHRHALSILEDDQQGLWYLSRGIQ